MTTVARSQAARLVALALIVALALLTRLPTPAADAGEVADGRFGFTEVELPLLPGYDVAAIREVHPSLDRISAWISSVGAAVALGDLDGDGLDNDLCWVDPRIDQVVVRPVPTTGDRYPAFALDAGPALEATMAPMGCVPADMNEDGRLDLLVYYWGRTPLAFVATGPPGPSGYRIVDIVPTGERWYTNAATFADFDGDGHLDLFIGNYFADGARILDPTAGGREEMQDSMSRAFNAGVNRLLLWSGPTGEAAVGYRAVPAFSGHLARGWTLAAGAADLDGDQLPELYVANDFGPDRLFHNRSRPGEVRFELLRGRRTPLVPSSKVLGRDSFKGMGVDFGDLNRDARFDIAVSNIAAEYALEESHFAFVSDGPASLMQRGRAPYVDRSEDLGLSRSDWSWDIRFGDFDADGYPEVLQATGFVTGDVNRWPELQELAMGNDELLHDPRVWPRIQPGDDLSGEPTNPFFVMAPDGRFYDHARDVGAGRRMVTRGIATGDVDGDGDLDFVVANQWESSYLYLNRNPAGNAALVLRLLVPAGTEGTRPAVGAVATVTRPDGERLVGLVDGGNGHSGVRSPEIHFGLGDLDPATELTVQVIWRGSDGAVRTTPLSVAPGRHTVVLGELEEDGR